MREVVPALYSISVHDPCFHASMSCRKAEIVYERSIKNLRNRADTYRVSQVWTAINMGKTPCRECWVNSGYDAENDPIAMRG